MIIKPDPTFSNRWHYYSFALYNKHNILYPQLYGAVFW